MKINNLKLIAHRGNINGPNPKLENSPLEIDKTLSKGYDVELDLWFINEKLFLGHDEGQYEINLNWLEQRKERLWIHCKNLSSIKFLKEIKCDFNFFFHESDFCTLTSKGFIWTRPGEELTKFSICVMPEYASKDWELNILEFINIPFGVCSDYINLIKNSI
mgnify:FL=1